MIVVRGLSPNAAYLRLLELATSTPFRTIDSRVGKCADLGLVAVELDVGERTGVLIGRGFNPAFALVETAWVLAGRNDLGPLREVIRDYGRFSDDGQTLNGAYGYRLRHRFSVDQIGAAVAELTQSSSSRRVVLSVFSPEDLGRASADIPCNTQLALRVVDGRLDMTVFNRSNDLWLGVPYNWFTFRCVQELVARDVRIPAGLQCHVSTCMHLYERDLDQARLVVAQNTQESAMAVEAGAVPLDVAGFLDSIDAVLSRASKPIPSLQVSAFFARYDDYRSALALGPPDHKLATQRRCILDVSLDEWIASRPTRQVGTVDTAPLAINPDTHSHLAIRRWFMSAPIETAAAGVKRAAHRLLPSLPELVQRGSLPGTRVCIVEASSEAVAAQVALELVFGTLDPALSNTDYGQRFKAKLADVQTELRLPDVALRVREMSARDLSTIFDTPL